MAVDAVNSNSVGAKRIDEEDGKMAASVEERKAAREAAREARENANSEGAAGAGSSSSAAASGFSPASWPSAAN